jgi:transposase
LPERLRRLYVDLEAMKAGHNGVAEVSQQFDVHKHTVRRGKKELLQETVPPAKKVRQKDGGRKKTALTSNLFEVLMPVLNTYIAGNPMKINVLWTNLTLKQIQEKLQIHCISVSCPIDKEIIENMSFCEAQNAQMQNVKRG